MPPLTTPRVDDVRPSPLARDIYLPADAPLAAPAPPLRLLSLDAYRGLVMVLMISAGLRIPQTVEKMPNPSALWQALAHQTDHVKWVGCSLWDLIQPSFMFMVGAAMAFSVATRAAKGQSFGRMLGHALFRSLVLVLLGVYFAGANGSRTNWLFTNVLAQIGLGYTFLFLVSFLKPRWQLATAIGILAAYWGAFALYPLPPADFDPAAYGIKEPWRRLSGFAAHWEIHHNFAAGFDAWFLNLFPRFGNPYAYTGGGYQTLNFVPSLVTMIFGLLAGHVVRAGRLAAAHKLGVLCLAAGVGFAAGWALDRMGVCPIVKRIWTPSWTLFSAGWCFATLAAFYLVIDVARLRAWSLPLVVVGVNSIAAYCMSMQLKPWVNFSLKKHFGPGVYDGFGQTYARMVEATLFLAFCWLVCAWLYRKKWFIKI